MHHICIQDRVYSFDLHLYAVLSQAELQKLDPLLAALAAVPWIDPEAEDGQRVPFIKSTVLDQVEGMGKQAACFELVA